MSSKFRYWVEKYQIPCAPLIHVGAHLVQERDEYRELHFSPTLWFEAIPQIANRAQDILKNYPGQKLLNCALWSDTGVKKKLYFAGHEGSSSSLLQPYLISASHPEVVKTGEISVITSTLDSEIDKLKSKVCYKILVLDVQGAEIEVIKGGSRTLNEIDYIISEISQIELYKKTSEITELIKILGDFGFIYVASEINRATGWGEGLFLHKRAIKDLSILEFEHLTVGKHIAKGRLFRTLILRFKNLVMPFQGGGE